MRFSWQRKGSQRVDLYVTNNRYDAVIEAKMHWGPAGKATLAVPLANAVKDAKRDRIGAASQRIAAVFYAPHYRDSNLDPVDDASLSREIARYSRTGDADLAAWSFPMQTRKIKGGGKASKLVYPGIVLSLKVV